MYSKLVDYGENLTLVPDSGIQFVEYGLDLESAKKVNRAFIERPDQSADSHSGGRSVTLLANWSLDDDPDAPPPYQAQPGDIDYELSGKKALEYFLDRWLPVPFLRIEPGTDDLDNETYARGPMDWVRMCITKLPERTAEGTHRVVFAFDTSLIPENATRPYLAPVFDDSINQRSFRLVHRWADIGSFLRNIQFEGTPETYDAQIWVIEWLQELYLDIKKAGMRRALRREDMPNTHEPTALYIVLVEFIAKALQPARVTIIDTEIDGSQKKPIDVDLVLDIGNARSCGILIQSFPDEDEVKLDNSLVLEMRDMEKPWHVYSDPFDSHVELAQVEIGPEHLARRSQRPKAFFWPSMVRLGAEASRYKREAEGTEAVTGMSSPKRYLSDIEPVKQAWSFRNYVDQVTDTRPPIERAIYRYVNNAGDVLEQLQDDERTRPRETKKPDMNFADGFRFSRSSFFTFMLMEVISQAMMMMNAPSVRRQGKHKDTRRRLRRIIMTIPSATPVQEQRIIRARAEAAIKLLWSLLDWNVAEAGREFRRPDVMCSWDEASSMHLVYLYGEIVQKLGGSIRALMDVRGKPRLMQGDKSAQERRSLRIASIDIGGGTTDMMVTTYFEEDNRALIPSQEFREGFRRAGDDLVREVVEHVVLASLRQELEASGVSNADQMLKEMFGGDRPNMSELEKHRRRQFVSGILRPVALGVLGRVESGDNEPEVVQFANFFAEGESWDDRILSYLTERLTPEQAANFDLLKVSVAVDPKFISSAVNSVLGAAFENIAEVLHHFDVDVVLLTGRPSRLPQVIDLLVNQLSVSPEKVIAVRDYRVGNWYPFRDASSAFIADPKTTAVVGGMLCALSERQLMNFTIFTDRMNMWSTARYIGQMENSGHIEDEKVYFHDVDMDNITSESMEANVNMLAPMRIGYRQLPYKRWVANPLYRLGFAATERDIKKPVSVTLSRMDVDRPDEDSDNFERERAQAALETFFVEDAEDREGSSARNLVELKLNTLASGRSGYWLDTGIIFDAGTN